MVKREKNTLRFVPIAMLVIAAAAFANPVWADTLRMKSGEDMKGLVVEEHLDRVVVSTADGERVILRNELQEIEYDDLEYSLLSLGRIMELRNRLPEAVSYYEKALAINPKLAEAQKAALAIKGKMWAQMTEGPTNEVEKQQAMEYSWRANVSMTDAEEKHAQDIEKKLKDTQGLTLEPSGDFLIISSVRIGSQGHKQGLRKGDALVSADGKSLRYLNRMAVIDSLIQPPFTRMDLEIEREIKITGKGSERKLKALGLTLDQEYEGLVVKDVKTGSRAESLGFAKGDRIHEVAGELTRYTPKKKVASSIEKSKVPEIAVKVRKHIAISRG